MYAIAVRMRADQQLVAYYVIRQLTADEWAKIRLMTQRQARRLVAEWDSEKGPGISQTMS